MDQLVPSSGTGGSGNPKVCSPSPPKVVPRLANSPAASRIGTKRPSAGSSFAGDDVVANRLTSPIVHWYGAPGYGFSALGGVQPVPSAQIMFCKPGGATSLGRV